MGRSETAWLGRRDLRENPNPKEWVRRYYGNRHSRDREPACGRAAPVAAGWRYGFHWHRTPNQEARYTRSGTGCSGTTSSTACSGWAVVSRLSRAELVLFDFEHSHHAVVFVIEDVAVEHPLPRIIVVAHDDSRRRMFRDVEHVLPGEIRLAHSVTVEHLELESMQVERVIHANDVLDLPDLGGADGGADVDAVHVHQLSVDHALAENDGAHRRRPGGIERRDFP